MPSREEYAACAREGLTQAETARKLGVARQSVSGYAADHGISFRRDHRSVNSPEARARGAATLRARSWKHQLTDRERDAYEALTVRARYRKAEALEAIGRGDLLDNGAHGG